MKPLFVPLKKEYYEAFKEQLKADCSYEAMPTSVKTEEFRKYGRTWTEKNCIVGRPVVLSCGYGKANRMLGVVRSFRTTYDFSNAYLQIYGSTEEPMAAVGIEVLQVLTGS